MQIYRYRDIQIYRYTDIQICIYTDIQIYRFTDIQICRYADIQIFRYTDRQIAGLILHYITILLYKHCLRLFSKKGIESLPQTFLIPIS